MGLLAYRQLERTDRYVLKARLSLRADAPQRKLAFMTEEALRLSSLPGEQEGLIYFFRRLHIGELPESGDRDSWLRCFQRALQEQAALAVHGSHAEAAGSDAVYFRSQQKACEALLNMIAARTEPTAWFWKYVSGVESLNSSAIAIAVIEKLLATPAGWSAVAMSVLSAAVRHNIGFFLKAIPTQMLQVWLIAMGTSDRGDGLRIQFSRPIVTMLAQAIHQFGSDSAQSVWIASLAVIAARPSLLESGSVLSVACASLATIASEPDLILPAAEPGLPAATSGEPSLYEAKKSQFTQANTAFDQEQPVRAVNQPGGALKQQPDSAECFGKATSGAGLFFLLNALRALQVEAHHLSPVSLARLFFRLASYAGIADDDPILLWAHVIEAENEPEEIDARFLRIWFLRVRRWCWRNGRLTVRDIVIRPGYVTLTRTDLDVTMYLDSADVRIRRIGLDLDPGWLPWFGRVVRFHYRYRGDLRG
jgi:hypothetical protein